MIFNLRDDVTFSDGTPVTAEDVVFTYELLRDKGLPSFRAQLSRKVASAEAVDDRTVSVTFEDGMPDPRPDPGRRRAADLFEGVLRGQRPRLRRKHAGAAAGLGALCAGQDRCRTDRRLRAQPRLLGRGPADQCRAQQFRPHPDRVFRRLQRRLRGLQGAAPTPSATRRSSKIWATGYDFPAVQNGWVMKEELPDGARPPARASCSTCAAQVPGPAGARGDRA